MKSENVETLWSHLHWLVVLAEQGSYTAAAARLGVSKAAMSQRIAQLERAVGVALVRRTTRSMRLTEAGQRLVDQTREPFRQIAHSFLDSRDQAETPAGLLRVTAPVALGRQQVVPRVAEFLRAHPSIRIELELSDRLNSLATEGFDLAIRHSASAPDTHVAWLLCRTASVLVASRAYLRRSGVPTSPADLADHACLHYPRGPDEKVWSFEPNGARSRAAGRVTVPIAGPMAVNNSEALRDAAQAGLGIALLPDFSAQAALRTGQLVQVLPDWSPVGAFADRIHAIRPYALHVPRALTQFVAHLREAFADGFAVRPG
ncbi:LysR family transcriptional regulator [Variovorax sp. J22P168]|uniref:LysR family transcriptional regulator n=1 Tax=Variovorax jilinensis TaxID=3053513 RepID=UPI0025791A76|nr:LysR family transcriptional regulator [Variovorax sp. J22P168]MDM0014576.1 LysR family transcriptional regulator [Variovorax sp. J22P168]